MAHRSWFDDAREAVSGLQVAEALAAEGAVEIDRRGARTALVTTKGFADILRIGYQNRPKLFELAVAKPQPLFSEVVEVDQRVTHDGTVLTPLQPNLIKVPLREIRGRGIQSLAVCLLNAYAHAEHE